MSAPPSPALSQISLPHCCLEGGSDGSVDSFSCSPEMKRVKRHVSAGPSTSKMETMKKKCSNSKWPNEVEESRSALTRRSVSDHKSYHCYEYDRMSNHSLPTLDFQAFTLSSPVVRRSSVENVGVKGISGDIPVRFNRRSLDEKDLRIHDEAELRNDRKARVVSSYLSHFKDSQLSERRSCSTNESAPQEVQDEHVKLKCGFSEMTYGSGEDLMPAPLETLISSRENESCCTLNSPLEDSSAHSRQKLPGSDDLGSKATSTPQPVGNAGDSPTWTSNVEKEYVNGLEFSTLVTLAYVRVRDLTHAISKSCSYLEAIDRREDGELKKMNELRSEIQAVFEERANLALEHSKWRSRIAGLYQQRRAILSNLKSQAALAEQSYFTLRKELEDLRNEPVVTKPKRSWLSKLCAFIK